MFLMTAKQNQHLGIGTYLRWQLWSILAGRGNALLGLLLVALLLVCSPPARADIWAYVDAERMPHFSSTQLDERYQLLLHDPTDVEPYRRSATAEAAVEAVEEADNARADGNKNTGSESSASAFADTIGAGAVAPRLLNWLAHSESYRAVSPLMREASRTHGIDYSLLKAVIATESGFNTHAVSPKGAVGLMQLIPPTAQRYGVTASKGSTIASKLTDPRINIGAGARYLADLIRMFPGRLDLALAAYNAGEGAVQRAGNRIPNYPETRHYVKSVMQLHAHLTPMPAKPVSGRLRVTVQPASTALSESPPSSSTLNH
jgi:soluble lytic murein transglycosylase-like protein